MTDTDARLLGLDDPATPAPPTLVAAVRALVERDDADDDAAERLSASGATEGDLVAALVAVVPSAIEAHRRAGTPPVGTRATLPDVGRKQRAYGVAHVMPWVIGILRGDVVARGRLQVERRAGAHGHALHIPEGGPLAPVEVDRSLAMIARELGDVPLVCTSWMLDPAIAEDLPESNLAHFARRFRLLREDDPAEGPGNEAVSKFVFRRPLAEVLDEAVVVPATSLERIVAGRLRAGYRWAQPVGLLRAAALD
jgi:hypothetical protein